MKYDVYENDRLFYLINTHNGKKDTNEMKEILNEKS